jgi:DNA primase
VIGKSKFDNNSIEEKKKLLKELIELVKTYSDNVEKDFYLKEISQLLDINMNIIYDIFNKTRIKHSNTEEEYNSKTVTSSEDIVIGYILNHPESLEKIKEELIFPEGL